MGGTALTRICEECDMIFDCEYNKEKHDEIVHLKFKMFMDVGTRNMNSFGNYPTTSMGAIVY